MSAKKHDSKKSARRTLTTDDGTRLTWQVPL